MLQPESLTVMGYSMERLENLFNNLYRNNEDQMIEQIATNPALVLNYTI